MTLWRYGQNATKPKCHNAHSSRKIRYKLKVPPSQIEIKEGSIETVVELSLQIPEFKDPHGEVEYRRRLTNTPHLILVAYVNEQPAGFKVGYLKEDYFYSWMGAILPAYRRLQLATQLAKAQEGWAKQQGYPHVTFKTRNHLKPMLLFAIKRGFHILAIEERKSIEEYRILLRKFL